MDYCNLDEWLDWLSTTLSIPWVINKTREFQLQVDKNTRSTAGLMEGWQSIVQVHDISGTKPLDLPSIIQQMRDNKLGRLRKFYNDTLMSKRDVTREKVVMRINLIGTFLGNYAAVADRARNSFMDVSHNMSYPFHFCYATLPVRLYTTPRLGAGTTTYRFLIWFIKQAKVKEGDVSITDSPATAEEKWSKRVRQENSNNTGKYQQAPQKQLKITTV